MLTNHLAPCDFSLFPKLRGCRYETIEEMKEAETKVIDTLTQEDFHRVLQKLLERFKCIAAGGDYFEGDESFMCVLSINVPIRKTSGNLSYVPRNRACPSKFLRLHSDRCWVIYTVRQKYLSHFKLFPV